EALEAPAAVLAAVAPKADRAQLLALEDVDAAIVVVDQLPELVGDGGADLAQLVQAVELAAEALEHLQVRDRAQVALGDAVALRPLDVVAAEDEAAAAAARLDRHHRRLRGGDQLARVHAVLGRRGEAGGDRERPDGREEL